jgi:hypothetical protein
MRRSSAPASIDGSIDESTRTFVHKLLSHLIEARQIVRTTLPKGRISAAQTGVAKSVVGGDSCAE